MGNRGNYITTEQWLAVDDYLVSNNGVFFAILQGDGNFCVYRGTGPEEWAHRKADFLWGALRESQSGGPFFAILQGDGNFCVYRGAGKDDWGEFVWGALQKSEPAGQYFAILQDDGNFCIYRGGPANNGGGVWCTMAIDPVVSVEVSKIDYDVQAASVLQSGPVEMYRETVSNQTAHLQKSSIGGSVTVTETSGWENALGAKVAASTEIAVGIPLLAEGKVKVSAELNNTFTWSGSTSRTKTWEFKAPVNVPPNSTIVALVSTTMSTIAVPYTLTGTLILESGRRMEGRSVRGTYIGTNSHDLVVKFVQQGALEAPMSVWGAIPEVVTT